jgi:hypothetical protein
VHALVATELPDLREDTTTSLGAAIVFVEVPDDVAAGELARDSLSGAFLAPAEVLSAVREAATTFRDACDARIRPLPGLQLDDFPFSRREVN